MRAIPHRILLAQSNSTEGSGAGLSDSSVSGTEEVILRWVRCISMGQAKDRYSIFMHSVRQFSPAELVSAWREGLLWLGIIRLSL